MDGYFGDFGGQFVPEKIAKVLKELENAFSTIAYTDDFKNELNTLLADYAGRPSPLFYAKNLSQIYGQEIYLKREDLNHTGSHKINNALGQALLAKKMGKKKLIAETGAGQHGVATATAAALFGLECDIYMGELDAQRQELNKFRMSLLGAKLIEVKDGNRTLNDAVDAAINAWVNSSEEVFYVLGSAVGPHPYPTMVAYFQSIIGAETKQQLKQKNIKADYIIACIGGGSNAIGIFKEFINDDINLIGVEAGGLGVDTKYHAATMSKGKEGIIHGMKTIVLQDDNGNIMPVFSISAGLDYPGVGPEHAYLKKTGRVKYVNVSDDECVNALKQLSRVEGIIPAIESSHALAYLPKLCKNLKQKSTIIVNISGRGDKDTHTILHYKKGTIYG